MPYKNPAKKRLARMIHYYASNENERNKELNSYKVIADPAYYRKQKYKTRINKLSQLYKQMLQSYLQGNYRSLLGIKIRTHRVDYGPLENEVSELEAMLKGIRLCAITKLILNVIGSLKLS